MWKEEDNTIRDEVGSGIPADLLADDPFVVARWVAASLTGELTPGEEKGLARWKEASRRNRRLYARVSSEENQKLRREQFASFDKTVGWKGYQEKRARGGRRSFSWRKMISYAALVLIVFGSVFYFWTGWRPGEPARSNEANVIRPGRPKAELILAGGQKIDLARDSGTLLAREGTVIQNAGNQLSYRDTSSVGTTDTLVYDEVLVPRAGEYQLRLSDGTSVYLNSMTRIRFPARFPGDRREVELEGEAYFEVAENSDKPFVVKTACCDVTVLGTRFNVTAYHDEEMTRATLVEGSVVLSGKGRFEARKLKPNEQFVLNKTTGEVAVEKVDTRYATAWKDGKFRFRDVRLEEIMHLVERWYDVTVIYEDEEMKDFRFGFNMSRLETIDPLLRVFELNGRVNINKEGKVLKISRGR